MLYFIKCACLCLSFSFVYMEQYYKRFELVAGKTIPDMSSPRKAVSISQCITHCLQEKECVAVVYNKTDQNCYLLDSSTTLEDTHDSGTSYVNVGGGCMDGWIEFGGSCYLIDLNKYTWEAAKSMCNELGARLIEIETQSENEYIKNILLSYNHTAFWIGLRLPIGGSTWQLASSGEDALYIPWDESQPNQVREPNCAVFWHTFDYRLGDESCEENYHPICEQDATYNMN